MKKLIIITTLSLITIVWFAVGLSGWLIVGPWKLGKTLVSKISQV